MSTPKKKADNSLSTVFSYESSTLRMKVITGQAWFVGKDVCKILGIKNHNDSLKNLEPDERRGSEISTPSGNQNFVLVNESGVYHLIFRSNKPEAKQFRKWVTSEVLPALRATGEYSTNQTKALPAPRKHNRLTPSRMNELLADICLIQDDKLRVSIMKKLTGREDS